MEAIIHPGMPKTGSSSIQATLVAAQPEGWVLPDTPTGNMSGQFSYFFADNPQDQRAVKRRGLSPEEVEKIRRNSFEKYEKRLKEGAANGLNAIFTGERISGSKKASVQRLADFFRLHGYQPRVVAYVRKPLSFMQSAFQQNIKNAEIRLNRTTLQWPNYRDRFEKLDQIFGKENVQLSLFDSKLFEGGDVCLDFFKRIGVEIPRDRIVRVNESMSLTACAMLFVQRNFGNGVVNGAKGDQENNAFVASVSRLPGPPLKFKRSFVEPVFEAWREDLAWMEERLGLSMLDIPDEDMSDAIGSEEDLLLVADRHREMLEEMLIAVIRNDGDRPRDRLVRNLELLRELHY